MSVPSFLSLSIPSEDERASIDAMATLVGMYAASNRIKSLYYQGQQTVQQFGISIPPSMRNLAAVAGWGGTVVDVIEERLDFLGWSDDGDALGLREVFVDNSLDVDSGMAHLDALIHGTSFGVVGTGADGEPNPLVTVHSPNVMTCQWDARRRRVAEALTVGTDDMGTVATATLYRPDETIDVEVSRGTWRVVNRDRHNLGRVPVVQFENRQRTGVHGRSEITPAVRYYTDAAVRTLLGMETNREFYSAPQRVVLGGADDLFRDEAGNLTSQWTAIQGRVWQAPADEDGNVPSIQQFTPASPAPYLDMVRGLAQLLAAEAGIPAAYLGFTTDNPASADAIRAGEARLVKRAERRQSAFGRGWLEVARLALLIRDGEIPPMSDVAPRWRDAATPTRAAAADEASKLIAAGVLPKDSTVTYDRIGLSPAEQDQIRADARKAEGRAALLALTAPPPLALPQQGQGEPMMTAQAGQPVQ